MKYVEAKSIIWKAVYHHVKQQSSYMPHNKATPIAIVA
jgi:hypothetical protein